MALLIDRRAGPFPRGGSACKLSGRARFRGEPRTRGERWPRRILRQRTASAAVLVADLPGVHAGMAAVITAVTGLRIALQRFPPWSGGVPSAGPGAVVQRTAGAFEYVFRVPADIPQAVLRIVRDEEIRDFLPNVSERTLDRPARGPGRRGPLPGRGERSPDLNRGPALPPHAAASGRGEPVPHLPRCSCRVHVDRGGTPSAYHPDRAVPCSSSASPSSTS